MPFINTKTSVKITDEKRTEIKSLLGQAIRLIPGKSESWLMLGFEDNIKMYFKGDDSAPTAFIEVKIFGSASASDYDKLTAKITEIFNSTLAIPSDRIYVKYEEVEHWGWNGSNF